MKSITLGSLFDGSGGFPLAGARRQGETVPRETIVESKA